MSLKRWTTQQCREQQKIYYFAALALALGCWNCCAVLIEELLLYFIIYTTYTYSQYY